MGCLSDLIKLTILVFAFIGFVAVGGIDFIKDSGIVQNSPNLQKFIAKVRLKNKEISPFIFKDTKSKADFSQVPKDKYKIEYQGLPWSTKSVLATSKDSCQSMVYMNIDGIVKVNEEAFSKYKKEDVVELLDIFFDYQKLELSDYEISGKKTAKFLQQQLSYYSYKAKMQEGPYKEISGVVAVGKEPDGHNILMVSFGFDQPFNFDEAQNFYNNIEFDKNE